MPISRPISRRVARQTAFAVAAHRGSKPPPPIDMTSLQTWTRSNNPAGYDTAILSGFSSSGATGTILALLHLSSGITPPTDILYSADNGASFAVANRQARTTKYAPTVLYSESLAKYFAYSYANDNDWDVLVSESVDGINWSALITTFLDGASPGTVLPVGHNGQKFIGLDGLTSNICASTDGRYWTTSDPLPIPPELSEYGYTESCCWVDGIQKWLVSFSRYDIDFTNWLGTSFYTSSDGVEWDAIPQINLPEILSTNFPILPSFVPSGMPIVMSIYPTGEEDGAFTERVYASWDAINWTLVHEAVVPVSDYAYRPTYYADGVIVLGRLRALKSPDGFRWGATSTNNPESGYVAAIGGYVVAGNFTTHPDGFYRAKVSPLPDITSIIAGDSYDMGMLFGYSQGLEFGVAGSKLPVNGAINGYEVYTLMTYDPGDGLTMFLFLAGDAPQSVFNTLTVDGATYASADATHAVDGSDPLKPVTLFTWPCLSPLVADTSYTVTYT